MGRIRNIVAHSYFSGSQGQINFANTNKKMGVETNRIIDDETFQKYRTEMADLWGWIAKITREVKMNISNNKKAIFESMIERRHGICGIVFLLSP